jgi:hypothetical protein
LVASRDEFHECWQRLPGVAAFGLKAAMRLARPVSPQLFFESFFTGHTAASPPI